MAQQATTEGLLNRRWIGPIYALFAVALLVVAALQSADIIVPFPLPLVLLLALLVAAALTGALIVRGRNERTRALAGPLLLADAALALALIALTGGYQSPLWVALLIVSTAAPLLLPGRVALAMLGIVWLADGLFLLQAPPERLLEPLMAWALRASGVLLIGLVVQHTLAAEERLRLAAERRERALHDFLLLSNRLRVTSQPQAILEEVARAVQATGTFDCVTISRLDWHAGKAIVTVALGTSGRRLRALEGLQVAWEDLAPLLDDRRRSGPGAYVGESLPFRSLRDERHVILLLSSQFGEPHGLMTVSYPVARSDLVAESLPLLELLANQAAAALDNGALYGSLEQRVQEATAVAARGQEELARARDRAEALYRVAQALADSTDEREVPARALPLLVQATGAVRGGIMLVEPNTGHLAWRSSFEAGGGGPAVGLELAQGIAGSALATRRAAQLADTRHDPRWRHPDPDRSRSVLAVPMLLEDDPLGVIVLASDRPEHFGAEHEQLALAAGRQVAVALARAQLYRCVSEQTERLGMTLRQREEEISKIEAILSSVAEGVVVGDRLGRVRMLNPAAAQLLGISAESATGRRLSDLPGAALEPGERAAGVARQVVVGTRTLRASQAPVRTPEGEWLGSVVVYHDITREALADRLKSEFIATASHELRTPLTSIRGYVDLLLLGTLGPVTQSQHDFLRIVKSNVTQLVELLEDLLDVSRVDAGELPLRREPLDIAQVIYEVTEALYTQFSERKISLAIDVAPGLPKVVADRQRLRQIILNLVSNACKYTRDGGHVDVVVCDAGPDPEGGAGQTLRVDVRDTGVGIAASAQPHIFTPFFRADNPLHDTAGGTGLGLSIAKTLVELHGGRIWFDSREGSGTTFSFTLPAGEVEWQPVGWLESVGRT